MEFLGCQTVAVRRNLSFVRADTECGNVVAKGELVITGARDGSKILMVNSIMVNSSMFYKKYICFLKIIKVCLKTKPFC